MPVKQPSDVVAAVNALGTSAKGNTYSASLGTVFPNGKTQVVVQKNGSPFLTVTHSASQAGVGEGKVAPTDANPSGAQVEWVDPANPSCMHIADAQQFVNSLASKLSK